MAHHNELGRYGEQLAAAYLTEKQFAVLCANWKFSRYEIDIIASKTGVLHFVEVKTRSNHTFGYPEESVDRKKMKKLMKAAEHYLYLHPSWKLVQYDVLSVYLQRSRPPEFFLIEDVYLYR